jgi:hypothetical protein
VITFDHFLYDYKIYLKSVIDVKKPSVKRQKTPIFWHALFRTYMGKLIAGAFIKLANDLCQFSVPMILK